MVVGQVCAFESRQSRSDENWPATMLRERNPILSKDPRSWVVTYSDHSRSEEPGEITTLGFIATTMYYSDSSGL
jgi:hypothetical protein